MTMQANELPLLHPDRPRARTRPLKALSHFRKLIADKEATEHVFHIFDAFPRKALVDEAGDFLKTEKGQRLFVEQQYLPDMLDNHDELAKLPAGSVGRTYMEFMQREGLSAAGLVAEQDKIFNNRPRYEDQAEWYFNRGRDTHDMLHILTGYGRDALGEQCVLAFTYGQNPNFANIFIAYLGGFELKRQVGGGAPVFAALAEARRNGKKMPNLVQQDIKALLAEDLRAARARLGIPDPKIYIQAHATYREKGIDPYDFLAPVAA